MQYLHNEYLTICLVTRGREKYIEEILASLELSLLEPYVRLLIIDNGADESIKEVLGRFTRDRLEKVEIVTLAVNDPRPSAFWNFLILRKIRWAIFPGDDDVLLPEAIPVWREHLEANPDMVAFAGSAKVINADSNLTGIRIKPDVHGYESQEEKLGAAFFQAPFIWPCLFLDVQKIPLEVPHSRYVFDWWIGLNLLIAGVVVTTQKPLLHYRNHSQQESSVSSNRRKYFEAMIWQIRFVQSKEFVAWLTSRDTQQIQKFWSMLKSLGPIYGDSFFGRIVLTNVAVSIINSCENRAFAGVVAGDLANISGVYLKKNEGWHISNEFELDEWDSNVSVLVTDSSCENLTIAARAFTLDSKNTILSISCRHSASALNSIVIDCGVFNNIRESLFGDILSKELMGILVSESAIEQSLTAGEKLLIGKFRILYKSLPGWLINFLKSQKRRALKS